MANNDFDNIVRVYTKDMELIAIFDKSAEGLQIEECKNLMIAPTVHLEQNGTSTFSFQMLANCEKWQSIKDPLNIYVVNGRYYTPLNEGSYVYGGNDGVRVVNVQLVERWYLLERQYKQAYNCGIYTYAKATFQGYTTDGAIFRINSSGCSNPGNTISNANAWEQVKLWTPKDDDGNDLSYAILKSEDYEPKNWEDAPDAVFITSFSISGSTATVYVKARAATSRQQVFEYSGTTYQIDVMPYPANLESVYVNSTITTDDGTTVTYTTSNKEANFSYNSSTGKFTLNYTVSKNETINSVIALYDYYNLGEITSGATCTLAYGAEALDDHTFVILPKANTKYKLTINGVQYEDSQVKDSRGVIMPRGSGGYALWTALNGTGWSLGVCDVLATGFDPKIDYGVFNVESDQKDVLYIVQYIQELYGGILDWDSKNKVVNYRAENKEDYQVYDDGFNDWTGYEFREGKNMTDQPQITYDNNLITKAFILGYGGLNIKNVNNGNSYVTDYSYTNDVYEGYLEQSLIYDTRDEGGQRQLLYWGKKEVKKYARPRKTIKASVTDIRTVEGYEHEVFDINNIVRIYYKDDQDKTESFEEQRITLWEYNVFSPFDCQIELGDKTQNFSELFKLIYNTAIENSPKANATGKISSDEITYSFASNLDLEDYINSKIGESYSSFSDLIIDVNENYSYAELFANYQKVTDRLVSETYAGLTLYADDKISSLQLVVEGNYKTLQGELSNFRTETQAGFAAQQSQNEAFTQQFSSLKTTTSDLQSQITSVSNAQSSFETYVSKTYATASSLTSYATKNYVTGEISSAETSIIQYVDDQTSQIKLLAKLNGDSSWLSISSDSIYLTKNLAATLSIDSYGNISISGMAHFKCNMVADFQREVYFSGAVDFSGATVTGLDITATFA